MMPYKTRKCHLDPLVWTGNEDISQIDILIIYSKS